MGRFVLQNSVADSLNPNSIIKKTTSSIKNATSSKINIVKNVGLSTLKSQLKNVLVGGKFDPSELIDPAKYLTEGQIDTLFGGSDTQSKPKFITPYGATATDYLVMIKSNTSVTSSSNAVKDSSNDDSKVSTSTTKISDTIQLVDLSAVITISQKKNIIMTKVEGRSRSRKEFISGGDFMVSISGVLCGDRPEQYPEEKVQILREMLTVTDSYDPVITVKSPILERFGITGLIILDFKIPQTRASRNRQEYQINAVFEEPAHILKIQQDDNKTKLQKALAAANEWVALDTTLITSI